MSSALPHAQPDVRALGLVVWVTGFSGAGKSTVSDLLRQRLTAAGRPSFLLDGDILRRVLGREGGYSPEERLELAWTYARLAQEISRQGIAVICATISMFGAVREWNRANNPNYLEIYLRVPHDQRTARDSKKVYTDPAAAGAGVHYQEPETPDLVIDNWGATSSEAAAATIWQHILTHGK